MFDIAAVHTLRRRRFLALASAFGPALRARSGPQHTAGDSGKITDVAGVRVGHFTETRRPTGCTVILFDNGAVAGVDVRGGSPGTRETDLLQPLNTVQKINAILLSGGSAFGLDAASGVMQFLADHGQGFHVGDAVVPIVPAAILFDLHLGDPHIHPDAQSGYRACQSASNLSVAEGSVGAGAGATLGQLFGRECAMKSGLGTCSSRIPGTDLVVGAMVAVNPAGDVRDYRTYKLIAGARNPSGKGFLDSMSQLANGALIKTTYGAHTTLGVVATNAILTKSEATKVAQMAQDGLARTINPVHTPYDGDTIFAAATGTSQSRADVTTLGSIGAEMVARAVNRAVFAATGIPGYPAVRDLPADF